MLGLEEKVNELEHSDKEKIKYEWNIQDFWDTIKR
jgi:hypothetical protein